MELKTKTAAAAPADNDLAQQIRHVLKLDSEVHDHRIRVEVHDGIATLAGTVETRFQKEAAEADAKMVKGIVGVHNQLDIEPAFPQGKPAV